MRIAEAPDLVAFPVVDAYSVSYVCDTALDGCGSLLSDVDDCVRAFAIHVNGGGFVDWPLSDELSVGGEDLHSVALSVADDY